MKGFIIIAIAIAVTGISCGDSESDQHHDEPVLLIFGQSNAVHLVMPKMPGIKIINTAVGDTQLSCDVVETTTKPGECWLGSLLDETIKRVGGRQIIAYVFFQGEADAKSLTLSSQYRSNLIAFMAQVEQSLGTADWAFSLLRTAAHRPGGEEVRKAILGTEEVARTVKIFDLDNYMSYDGTHLVPGEYKRLGDTVRRELDL